MKRRNLEGLMRTRLKLLGFLLVSCNADNIDELSGFSKEERLVKLKEGLWVLIWRALEGI
jgi:hypothetical protein